MTPTPPSPAPEPLPETDKERRCRSCGVVDCPSMPAGHMAQCCDKCEHRKPTAIESHNMMYRWFCEVAGIDDVWTHLSLTNLRIKAIVREIQAAARSAGAVAEREKNAAVCVERADKMRARAALMTDAKKAESLRDHAEWVAGCADSIRARGATDAR